MTNLFEKAFVHILKEQPEDVVPPSEMTDSDALEATLDKGSQPEDFDADAAAAQQHTAAASEMHLKMVDSLKQWISKLDEFSKFLNGTDPQSMQSRLQKGVKDSLFDKIRIAETKKISRVSMEISSLNEMLKGYLASSNDAKYLGR